MCYCGIGPKKSARAALITILIDPLLLEFQVNVSDAAVRILMSIDDVDCLEFSSIIF